MASYFLCEINIEYKGMSLDDLLAIWLEEANLVMSIKEMNSEFQIWKIVGERKIVFTTKNTNDGLDRIFFNTPLFKKLGNQVHVNVTALRTYEDFGNDLSKAIGGEENIFKYENPVERKGIFYWLKFNAEYEGLDQLDLFKIWVEEANAALDAKKKGIVFDLFKVVGERIVHAFLCVDSPDMLDQITFNLPLMKKLGNQVHIEVKSLRNYGAFRDDLKKWCEK